MLSPRCFLYRPEIYKTLQEIQKFLLKIISRNASKVFISFAALLFILKITHLNFRKELLAEANLKPETQPACLNALVPD